MRRAKTALLVLLLAVTASVPCADAKPSGFGGGSRGSSGGSRSSGFTSGSKSTGSKSTDSSGSSFSNGGFGGVGGSSAGGTRHAFGTAPSAFAGGSTGRWRYAPLVAPFAMGLFLGSATHSYLNRNPSARCNGNSTECYKDHCLSARQACGGAGTAAQRLLLSACPNATYSECWETEDSSMLCLGRPRPNATANVDTFCSAAWRRRASGLLSLLTAVAMAVLLTA